MSDTDRQRPNDALDAAGEPSLSLEQLGRVYAKAMGLVPDAPAEVQPEPDESPGADEFADAACPVTPRSIVEAILFVGTADHSPIPSRRLASVIQDATPAEIEEWIAELNESYRHTGAPYRIASSGGGYRMVLDQRFDKVRQRLYGRVRQTQLSQAAIDVLAIVVYHQPITRQEVDRLRDRPSGAVLSQLVRRGLLTLEASADEPAKKCYRTSSRFLEVFGLASLDELPQSHEIDLAQ
jgi:segregation and condensation protein B